ncbi:peptidoglycan-binding protein LysM [Nonlabens ponticola]|uniref:Peptidoglycan-binding protein LysM n=1 Tax=Nonlabens ponticola TaxID=2496866 RepID=A0A3S9MY59_9FLAO|nr:peptidoglycan-binding protein LysM [Nonlabens ponticola]AZQ44130.1 peptidoglycan-binding protein LysM [Nonlabens ponticola]
MRTQITQLLAYPLILIMGFFLFKKDRVSKISVKAHQESRMTYIKSNAASPYGPFLEDYNFEIDDVRDFSLATSSADSFISFKEALAFKESQGKYWKVNSLGYLGKYQFGMTTLNQLGVRDSLSFMRSRKLQERVFLKNIRYNHKQLQDYIDRYEGQTIGGVEVTESGILAAAHLSGVGGVKKYLRTNGRGRSRDAYGSSVRGYMKRFAGYNLSEVLTK